VRPGRRDKKLCCVRAGLDNAGKTTLIYRLKSGKINSFIPTQRANIEEFVRRRRPLASRSPSASVFWLASSATAGVRRRVVQGV
jgi:GTPase SAR1 family protein